MLVRGTGHSTQVAYNQLVVVARVAWCVGVIPLSVDWITATCSPLPYALYPIALVATPMWYVSSSLLPCCLCLLLLGINGDWLLIGVIVYRFDTDTLTHCNTKQLIAINTSLLRLCIIVPQGAL